MKKFDATIKIQAESKQQAEQVLKQLGLKLIKIELEKSQRTLSQNDSMHLWFSLLEKECASEGITMDMVITKPQEIPITRHLLKDLFRLIGLKSFKRKSTSDLEKLEFMEVQKVFEKTISERTGIYVPFPCIENNYLE